ncbi:MAG: protein kinase [Polyangiaceae bacterium]
MALPNKAKIPVGFVLSGKYRITREIGRGGMAAVYEAENIDIGKRVAIKVLAQELTASAVVVERFLREARAAAAIRSPYICDVYDSGRLEDGRPFLVLELLEGESLYERMTKVRHMDAESTLSIISQTCRGLTKAHAASIVHRDLKPENIFLTKDEESSTLLAKILDFGLAKFYLPMDGSGGEKQARLTREGAVFGTPAYMSPEQVRGQGAVDHRADLWALGCITYECLTGKTVWATEQGVAMTFAQIANAPLPRPAKIRPDVPIAFTEWFDKALDRNIDKRFQTAKEFAEELAAAFEQGPPSFSAIHDLSALQIEEAAAAAAASPGPAAGLAAPAVAPARRYSPDAVTQPPQRPGPNGHGAEPAGPGVDVTFSEPPPRPGPAATGPAMGAADPVIMRSSRTGFTAPPPRSSEPTTKPNDTFDARATGRSSRGIVVFGVLLLLVGAADAGYRQLIQPPTTPRPSNSARVDAGTPLASSGVDAGRSPTTPVSPGTSLPWRPLVADAQAQIAADDLKGAQKTLREAFDRGGHGVPRTMLDHVNVAVAASGTKQPCRLTGLGRPRTYDLAPNVRQVGSGRPAIALGPRGAVMTWTDGHEGNEHAWAVAFDEAMRGTSEPYDVTPEGALIGRPELTSAGDKVIITYWDTKGPEAGVHVRWLEPDGRIGGPSVPVTPPKPGNFWPSLTRMPDGSYVVVWTQEEGDSEDLWLRRLTAKLELQGDAVRISDLAAPLGASKVRARLPWAAVQSDSLMIAFRYEKDPQRLIHLMKVPLGDVGKGVPAVTKPPAPRTDRMLGETVLVNVEKDKADAPSLACGTPGCFLAWHGEGGRAQAAFIEPQKAAPLWRKPLSKAGADPVVGIGASGEAQLAWYERGHVMTASVGRDAVGPPSKVARISGDQPMPSIAAGAKPGEWYVAWLDFEAGHLEPYAARVQCK